MTERGTATLGGAELGPARHTGRGGDGEPRASDQTLVDRVVDMLRPVSILEFRGEDPWPAGEEADLTICLDHVMRQADPASYLDLVARLVRSARTALLVSGYERPASTPAPTPPFHEALSTTLQRCAPDAEIYPLDDQQEIGTFLVLKPPASRHPRDFGARSLREVVERHTNALRLCELRLAARRSVGFYPDHAPRLWEYPAVVDLIEELAGPGASVVDIGSGVSPLAPYLTAKGYVVDTVDPSPILRSWPPRPDWDEWGYLDYAAAGHARHSWNTTLERIPPGLRYDVVCSVSVIEHLPAEARRQLLSEARDRLHHGGLLLLTVDIVRGSDVLWNRVMGAEVEDPSLHGTFPSLLAEVTSLGMSVLGAGPVRGWGDVQVDIGLVVARRA